MFPPEVPGRIVALDAEIASQIFVVPVEVAGWSCLRCSFGAHASTVEPLFDNEGRSRGIVTRVFFSVPKKKRSRDVLEW